MKPKFLLGLALVLSGGWFSVFAEQSAAANSDQFDWGEAVGGFQMAASLDASNGIIHCRIRNATTDEMDYPSFDFGYMENISLEVRETTNWIKLRATVLPRSIGASSACPYFLKRIKPEQIITDTYVRSRAEPWPVQKYEVYLKWAKGNTNEALLNERLNRWYADRETLAATTVRNDTFAIDLFDMDGLLTLPRTNSLEARVSQTFRSRREDLAALYSPVFTLSNSLLQSCAKENRAASIIHHLGNKP